MAKATEIYVLDRAVRLLQPADGGFRTSLDSVFLASACPAGPGDRVLDMGSGVGGAAFCVLHRVPQTHVTGVEIQGPYAALARDNIALNDAEGRAEFVESDIRTFKPDALFDHVICNPPYFESGAHTPSPDETKAIALGHTEDEIDVATWVDCGFRHLKSRGSLTFIHRARDFDRIVQAMGKRFGGITVIPLWPRAGEGAKRVIVRAVKDSRSPAILHPGITLHEDGEHTYTAAADDILRRAKALA
jgi:tRNA1(Val) A37 N6-methylase TrmN6